MKILLNRTRAKKLKSLLISKNYIICALLYIAGVVGLASFADLRVNQNTFVSENALLPGYVITKYNQDKEAETLHREYSQLPVSQRHSWIVDKFTEYGLEVYNQNFSVNRPLLGTQMNGNNIYAVYRAPKVASTEAIVFSTTLKDRQHAVPLMLSVCELISRQTVWAKDVIFLVSEQEEYGISAWLEAYHDKDTSPHITSSPLVTHSGAIQAALHLDMPDYQFDRVRMYVEAVNGQLPDIDLVVLVRQICRQEGIHLLLRNDEHDIGDFAGNLLGLHANMAYQAAGRVSFPSAMYHPYNIHAVGIHTERKYTTRYRWAHIGRFTESVLRSVNNLEEQFHTAYYFYLLPCIERFVCLSVYMIPCGIILAATIARVLCLWLQCGTNTQTNTQTDSSSSDKVNMFYSDTDVDVRDCVYPLIHGLMFGVMNEILSHFFTQHNLPYLLLLSQVVVIVTGTCFTSQRCDWKLHQAFVLLLHILTLVVLSMLNISLTIFYAVPTTLVYLLQLPLNKPLRVVQRALLLLCNPLVLVAAYSYLYTYLHLPNYQNARMSDVFSRVITLATDTIESKYTLGVWTWSAYSYILLPVWGLQWTLHIPSCPDTCSKTIKQD